MTSVKWWCKKETECEDRKEATERQVRKEETECEDRKERDRMKTGYTNYTCSIINTLFYINNQ